MRFSKYNIITPNSNGTYLLYNSISKASVEIDNDFKQKYLDVENISALEKSDYDFLVENNFIIDETRDETKELEYMFNANYFSKDPLNIVLVPTLKCNFSCPYCFEKVVCDKYNNPKYFETLKEYAKKQFHHHSLVQISLFGGEPLIYEKQALEFLEFAKQDSLKYGYDLKTSIVTNGSLLNEYNLSKLIEYGLFSLQITLDGGEKSHNTTRCFKDGKPSFDILIEKIKMVVRMTKDVPDFLFNLRINLNNNSEKDLEEVLDRFTEEERAHMRLLIRVIYNTDKYQGQNQNNLDDLKKYYDIALNKGANLVKNSYFYQVCEACADARFFYLMPDMTMWKCINDLNFEKAKVGKIEDDGSVSINFENIINWYDMANCFKDEKCLKCKKLPDCFGGCVLHKAKKGDRSCKTFDMACLPYCMKKD